MREIGAVHRRLVLGDAFQHAGGRQVGRLGRVQGADGGDGRLRLLRRGAQRLERGEVAEQPLQGHVAAEAGQRVVADVAEAARLQPAGQQPHDARPDGIGHPGPDAVQADDVQLRQLVDLRIGHLREIGLDEGGVVELRAAGQRGGLGDMGRVVVQAEDVPARIGSSQGIDRIAAAAADVGDVHMRLGLPVDAHHGADQREIPRGLRRLVREGVGAVRDIAMGPGGHCGILSRSVARPA